MHRRTLCCPLQIVQYLSHVQRSSGKSHCAQTVGPCMSASLKTVPEQVWPRKARVAPAHRFVYLLPSVLALIRRTWVAGQFPVKR
jgi:hypothetical protein